MFNPGDKIVYGGIGICNVEKVGPLAHPIPGAAKDRKYYTLRPMHETGVVYTPVDTTVFMRPVMSRVQAEELVDSLPEVSEMDCADADYKQMAEYYRAALNSYQVEELLRLLKTVWVRRGQCREQGKNLGKVDRQFQQTAEKFLHEELSCALEIPIDEVETFIENRLADQPQKV